MLGTIQEVAVYIHRFHNLDLFQQGWYQIKITMRWEDSESISLGTPARVVEYEAPDMGSGNIYGMWRIDDTDHSFSTHPFRIKYAREDIDLSMMISFNLSLGKFEGLSTTAAILKFELMFSPKLENGADSQASLDLYPTAVHEFRIPPKALLGLHSYCPVHFDTFHAVLVDVSVHVGLVKAAASYQSTSKVLSSGSSEVTADKSYDTMNKVRSKQAVSFWYPVLIEVALFIILVASLSNVVCRDENHGHVINLPEFLFQDFGFICLLLEDIEPSYLSPGFHIPIQEMSEVTSEDVKCVADVKALLTARDILLEELQKLSKVVDQAIDISESKLNNKKLLNSILQEKHVATDVEDSGQGKPQNGLERGNILDLQNSEMLHSLSKSELIGCFSSLGDQLMYLWSIFLILHRDNRTKILEFLCDAWAKDRKIEWSIWMVYSKFEMPHHYINSGIDEPSHRGVHRQISSSQKIPDDPPHIAAKSAELHRRSIAQMRINSRSIQDMYIFGDPSRVPIVIVERVMNIPRRTNSENSYLRHVDLRESLTSQVEMSSVAVDKQSAPKSTACLLKIVVFVHGFQGHHLDLRLIRNQWLLIDPEVEVLMSEANEDKTSESFREMGQRLAQEVISFVKRRMDRASKYGSLKDIRLSFVGHSIGNLIIRTAIAESMMEPFLRYLHTYVSVSGPHLGYLYSSNSLFNSGMWLLKKLRGSQCIHQLTFTDDSDIQNTFLYKLCKQKTLDHFKHVILLSSPQDGYVPYHSARIQSCQAASSDNSKRGRVFMEMLNECLDQIRANTSKRRVFMRCDVNFDTTAYGKNLNSFIGRAAHIDFLESDIFTKFIMWSFPELFK